MFDAFFVFEYSMSEIYHNCQERGLSDALHIRAAENCEVDNYYFKNWGHSSLDIDGNSFGSEIVKVSFISFHNNYRLNRQKVGCKLL
jgi:hypothetical protein